MLFSKVCIVGSGYLGTQIGVLCAKNGYTVSMQDVSPDALRNSEKAVHEYILEWVREGALSTSDGALVKQRISYMTDLGKAVQGAGLVVEAVIERLDIKQEVFKKLDQLCSPDILIATNSSSIKVSYIEEATQHPERVLNMHFYGYPWRRSVVELMKGKHTTDEVMETVRKFSHSIDVYPLMVLKESTGFIFNRVWRAIKKECLTVVDQGVATFEDVARAWVSLYNTEAGPFGLMDRVGLDVVRDIEMVYYKESGDPRDQPPKVLLDKISKGELGVKTGKGFYEYPNPSYMSPGWLNREK